MSVGFAKLRHNSDNIRSAELSNLEHMTVSFGEHRKAKYGVTFLCNTAINIIVVHSKHFHYTNYDNFDAQGFFESTILCIVGQKLATRYILPN